MISQIKSINKFPFFSNTDGSLSDTAVGLQGFDRRGRNPNQRSPKSETTPTRERERFGTGMGKKSNSTSQLSATGKLISPHLCLFGLLNVQ